MRTHLVAGWILGMVLAGGAVNSGFAQGDLDPSQTPVSPEQSGAGAPAPATTAPVAPGTPPQAVTQPPKVAPAVPGHAADQPPASTLRLSPWYYEIQRLTQAGVEDGVVLSYIYNSAGTFNITADQVIALRNLGASPQVISAMMRHDRQLITGERPLTATATPAFPPDVQAALAASLHPAGQPSPQPATVETPPPAPSTPIVAPEDEPGTVGTLGWAESDYPPDPPQGPYPVRLPYPVKLSDPIIMLRLPSFALPCW
jgi:hypothetical protein